MALLLSTLAAKLGLKLKGDDREFIGLNTLEEAGDDEVSFLANPKYTHLLQSTRACAVILQEKYADHVPNALVSENPYLDFARAASLFVRKQGQFEGVSDLAVIHPTALLGDGCSIHPHAHVGARSVLGDGCLLFPGTYIGEDCILGKNCTLYPNAVILAGVELGDNCVINPGAVIGTDGFGFQRFGGDMHKVPQIGTVRLSNGVDIGANTCIDRSTLGATTIGADTKIDNLVQVGHNVSLGEQCLIISQVGIAGSTKAGDRVVMAGQAGIAGHLKIGDDVTIGPQAGVAKDIPSGVSGSGSPFMESNSFLRSSVLLPKLPELAKRIRQLELQVDKLKEQLADASFSSDNGSEPTSKEQ